MSLSQYAGSQLLNRDDSLLAGNSYGGQIQWMRDQQLRQALKREQEKKQAELESKQNEGGILGAIGGAIGGGITGFISGGMNIATGLAGAASGGLKGFQSGRESGDGGQGAISGTLSVAGDAASRYLTDQASAKELAQKKELLSEQYKQDMDKAMLTQGLVPDSQSIIGKSVMERLGEGESVKTNASGGLSVYANDKNAIPIDVAGKTQYYKPFISPEKQAEMDLKLSVAKQTSLDKKEQQKQLEEYRDSTIALQKQSLAQNKENQEANRDLRKSISNQKININMFQPAELAQLKFAKTQLPSQIKKDPIVQQLNQGYISGQMNFEVGKKLPDNATAQTSQAFMTAKMFDNGKLSDKDVAQFMQGNPSLANQFNSTYSKMIKGQKMSDIDKSNLNNLVAISNVKNTNLLIETLQSNKNLQLASATPGGEAYSAIENTYDAYILEAMKKRNNALKQLSGRKVK